jgi:hypothetical protein
MHRQQNVGGSQRLLVSAGCGGSCELPNLGKQRERCLVRRRSPQLALAPAQEMSGHFRPVHDPLPEPGLVEDESHDVVSPGHQRRIDQRPKELLRRSVRHQQIRVPVEYHGAERFVAIEDELEDAADVPHVLRIQGRVPVDVRVAASFEQPVAVAKRNVQGFRNASTPDGLVAIGLFR